MPGTSEILRKLSASSTMRSALSLLFVFNTVLLICFSQCFAYYSENGFYSDGGASLKDSILTEQMEESGHNALLYFHYHLLDVYSDDTESAYLTEYAESFSEENSNFFFVFLENDIEIFSNYTNLNIARTYCPNSTAFFQSDENVALLCGTSTLTFEGYLKKELTANDAYMKIDRFFRFADVFKYAVIALLCLCCTLEVWFLILLYRSAGIREGQTEPVHTELDRIPLYQFFIFFIPAFTAGIFFLHSFAEKLYNWPQYLSGSTVSPNLFPNLYSFFLLVIALSFLFKMLVSTLSVRLKSPLWWQQSVLFRTIRFSNIEHRLRFVLTVMLIAEVVNFTLLALFYRHTNTYIFLFVDTVFSALLIMFVGLIEKNVSVWISETHRMATEQRGSIPVELLSSSFRSHADNINALSRSANAETEKRYINESFSTRLINNISGSLRGPLSAVTENIARLESGTLNDEEEKYCVDEINSLSQELKKTIEDLILISKATTGNLEVDAIPSDIGLMLGQTIGEYAEQFSAKGIDLVITHPDTPMIIQADGQLMWYIFDGILSALRQVAVPGTRIFLQANSPNGYVNIVFRACVRSTALEEGNLQFGNSLGLPIAKVFAELQGGMLRIKCAHDALNIVLQFPQKS